PPVGAATSVKAFNIISAWDGVSPFQVSGGADGDYTGALGSAVLPIGQRAGLTNLLVGDDWNQTHGAVFRLFLSTSGRVFQENGLDSILRFGGPTPSASVSGWTGNQPSWTGIDHFAAALALLSGPSANGDIVVVAGRPYQPGDYAATEDLVILSVHEDGRATL